MEGIQHVMKMALKPMHTPDLDTPRYQVLKRMCDYEIRCYPQFLTAEVPMPSGSSPASGNTVQLSHDLLQGLSYRANASVHE